MERFINRLIAVDKVGFFAWEAIVQTGQTIYYFTTYTRRGAHKVAQQHIDKENKRHGTHRTDRG